MTDTSKYFGSFDFWPHLSENEVAAFNQNAVIKSFKKGSLIFDSGSECLGFDYIIKGSIRTYMMSDEGREVTLFRQQQGDCCVLAASCVIKEISFESFITTEEDTEVLIINPPTASGIKANNVYFRCFIYELAAKRFSEAMKTMDNLLFLKLEGRLSSFLVGEYERTGITELRMTHEQVAQYINSAREVVARTLKRFSQEGLVELKRGVIKLLDIEALKEMY